jgi:hypothetical protein
MTSRQFERVMYRGLAVARRLGLPEDVARAISVMSRATMIARELSMSLTFLEMQTPYGWVMAILGVTMGVFSAVDTLSYSLEGT